ncbi:ketoacyl-synthetase C-terminal extension domain-containing protein [Streptomyces mirabilis]|uniref:ketoacyl-synthetase C-terminal extension domain-containing protein n=1 Tax=Streptomyces mirabilis TaxID=68239 RepID=UPI00332E7A4D
MDWAELRLAVPRNGGAWPSDTPRIAGLSSFGVSGTNAHAVMEAINTDGAPASSPNRRALAYASDHREAAGYVAGLYEELGFDAVDASPLSESWPLEHPRPAFPIFPVTKERLFAYLTTARRAA